RPGGRGRAAPVRRGAEAARLHLGRRPAARRRDGEDPTDPGLHLRPARPRAAARSGRRRGAHRGRDRDPVVRRAEGRRVADLLFANLTVLACARDMVPGGSYRRVRRAAAGRLHTGTVDGGGTDHGAGAVPVALASATCCAATPPAAAGGPTVAGPAERDRLRRGGRGHLRRPTRRRPGGGPAEEQGRAVLRRSGPARRTRPWCRWRTRSAARSASRSTSW